MQKNWQALTDSVARALWRVLRRPGVTIGGSMALGLALGANVAAFALLYGYLFRPLPYVSSGELLTPREQLVKIGLLGSLSSGQLYDTLRRLPQFQDAALYHEDGATVAVNSVYRFEPFASVTPSAFTLLGVKPLLGRTLTIASGEPGGPREAVLSYAYWQRAFGGSPDALGSTLAANGMIFRIVGVMPADFAFPERDSAFWVPFVITPQLSRDPNVTYQMLIRRPHGWSIARIDDMFLNIRNRLIRTETSSQQTEDLKEGFVIDAVPYRHVLLAEVGGTAPFWGLWAATLTLLILAALNTLNLTLARQRQRMGELYLREILGADRRALTRMLLVEHAPILLGTIAVAVGLAIGCLRLLHGYGLPSTQLPFRVTMGPIATAYLVAVALVTVASIASGAVISALFGNTTGTAIQELSMRGTPGRTFRQAQRLLAAAQICLALVLCVSGLLFTESLLHLLDRPLHFQPENVSVATVMLPENVAPSAFWLRTRTIFSALPGVRAVGIADMLPFGDTWIGSDFAPYGSVGTVQHGWFVSVSPEFFQALDVHLVAGRLFGPTDGQTAATEALVSVALAQAIFGRTDVVGAELQSGPMHMRIVGVVPTLPWGMNPAARNEGYAVYLPLSTIPTQLVQIVLKSSATPAVLWPALRRAIAAGQPNAAISRLRTMSQIIANASLNRAALTWLVFGFGILAFLIAIFGVYAIIAYGIRLRLYELAVRQILGATRHVIIRLILKEVAVALAAGGIAGVILAFTAARALRAELYAVGVLDPIAYLGSLAVIATAVFGAALIPAWRASCPNPAEIMRQ